MYGPGTRAEASSVHIRTKRSAKRRIDESTAEVEREVECHRTVDAVVGAGDAHDVRRSHRVIIGAVEQAAAINDEALARGDITSHAEAITGRNPIDKLRRHFNRGVLDTGEVHAVDTVERQVAVQEERRKSGVWIGVIDGGRTANGRLGRRQRLTGGGRPLLHGSRRGWRWRRLHRRWVTTGTALRS